MYTLQGRTQPTRHTLFTLSPRVVHDHTYLTRSTYSNISYSRQQIWTNPLHSRRMAPDTIHSTTVIQSRVCTQLLSHNSQRAVEKSQAPVDHQLLDLPGLYHRHANGTFNTCSWGPTERSLINAGGDYNFGGVGLPHTHFPTLPTSCLHFPLVAPPGLHFNQVLANRPKCLVLKEPIATTWSFDHSTIYHGLHLHLAIANDLSLVVRSQG
jgi:hypothetical protein